YVAREVTYWLDHRPLSSLLIALTGGDIVWNAARGDFDAQATTALPKQLYGRFAEEPRWIDLRPAHSPTQMSPQAPYMRDRIADLAAPLHHLAKDEMVGEHLRQHRRTKRVVRSVIALLTVLTVLAGAAAVVAVDQAGKARQEQRLAIAREWAALAQARADS